MPEAIKEPLRRLLGLSHPNGLSHSERKRIAGLPRFQDDRAVLFGKPLMICDGASFLSSHKEIFEERLYEFNTGNPCPTIVDAGANIGLASIFFASLFPRAKIFAIESDPHIFDILQANLLGFAVDVETIQGAAWDKNEPLSFHSDHADGGRIADGGTNRVQGIRLRDLICDRPIELLKMDIEGAESRVLADCADSLNLVERVFVEYHSLASAPQDLSKLLEVFQDNGFRYYIQQTGVHSRRPFLRQECEAGYDLQLNIFAVRNTLRSGS